MTNIPVYCTYFSKLSTKSVLKDLSLAGKINQSATIALQKMQDLTKTHVDSGRGQNDVILFKNILELSREFAINSGLLRDKKTKETIEKIEKNGGHTSMIMLGNSVMSDIPFKDSIKYTISTNSAHLL